MSNDTGRLRRRRIRLWNKDPRCRRCGVVTVLPEDVNGLPENMATIEHMDGRMLGTRGTFRNVERTTLWCRKCNNDHNNVTQAEISKELRRARARLGHHRPRGQRRDEWLPRTTPTDSETAL